MPPGVDGWVRDDSNTGMSLGLSLVAVPFLILMNAFFVAAEYAVVAAKPGQIEGMRVAGRRRSAAGIEALQSDPAGAIGTIQVCITMTNLLLGWIGEPAMSALLHLAFGALVALSPAVMGGIATALSFVVVTLVTVVFSELLPKALTLRHAALAAALTAIPVLMVRRAIRPLLRLMNAIANAVTVPLHLGRVDQADDQLVTVDELRMLATRAAEAGVLSSRERSLVLNSLAVGRRKAKEIMVPRTRVALLDLRHTMEQNREVAEGYLHTRLPLCDGGLDHVVGVVHVKDFLSAYHAGGDTSVLPLLARPPVFLPETVPVDSLLATLQAGHTQMAFLVDEYGGVEGIVTLQDVVEELIAPADGAVAPAPPE